MISRSEHFFLPRGDEPLRANYILSCQSLLPETAACVCLRTESPLPAHPVNFWQSKSCGKFFFGLGRAVCLVTPLRPETFVSRTESSLLRTALLVETLALGFESQSWDSESKERNLRYVFSSYGEFEPPCMALLANRFRSNQIYPDFPAIQFPSRLPSGR